MPNEIAFAAGGSTSPRGRAAACLQLEAWRFECAFTLQSERLDRRYATSLGMLCTSRDKRDGSITMQVWIYLLRK